METPYRAVSFVQHDIITRDKMDQLSNNYQWIKDNTPRGRLYRDHSKITENYLVVLAGRKNINRDRKSSTAHASVKFGRAFDPGCYPNVTTGVCADFQRTIFCVVNGPGGKKLPNSTGFDLSVAVQDNPSTKKKETIKKDFWVHWSAFGYRTSDMNVV